MCTDVFIDLLSSRLPLFGDRGSVFGLLRFSGGSRRNPKKDDRNRYRQTEEYTRG